MPKANRPWIVTPHGPLQKLENNLWVVESPVPGIDAQRWMSIVRQPNGELIFYHAVPLDERALAEILAWGKPKALVIGHANHGIDAHAFADKLGIGIYGPRRCEAQMRKRWPNLAGNVEDLALDSSVRFEEMQGTKYGEPVEIINSNGKISLVFCDAYQAMDSSKLKLMTRLIGFGGGPKVAPVFKLFFMSDKKALKAHFERLAAIPGLTRLVPCHGEISHTGGSATLLQVAQTLA